MRQLKYYVLSLLLAGGLSACNSLLDEEPLYSQNSSNVFASAGNAELALLGCYAYMSAPNGYGQMWQEVPIIASGFAFTQRNGGEGDNLVSLNIPISNPLVSYAWQGMYKVIAEVNAFLESLAGSALSEEVKTQYGGEAKFLRAVAYYNLVTTFGNVPLKTAASSSEGIAVPRSPREEVFAQVIADLQDATALSENSEDGRANARAAKAYLGKVYHKMARLGIETQSNLQLAKATFDDVYAHAGYELEPDFANLFADHVRGSKESIFQLNYTTESTICFNRGCNRFAPTASTTGISWGTYRASKAAYDLMQGTYPDDPRIAHTFQTTWRIRGGNNQANPRAMIGDALSANDSSYLYPYIVYNIPDDFVLKGGDTTKVLKTYITHLPYAALSNAKNPSISEIERYQETHGENAANKAVALSIAESFAKEGIQSSWPAFMKLYDQQQVGTRSHKNLMVYRYAELLLLMADVYNELGETPRAIALANEVLQRARNSSAVPATEPQDWPETLGKEEVEERLYFERLFEFFGEPNMFEMVRLCGTPYMKKAWQYHNDHEITRASAARYAATSNVSLDRLYNDGNLTEEFLHKNLLLPIPQSEINANSSITNADNNYGYQ